MSDKERKQSGEQRRTNGRCEIKEMEERRKDEVDKSTNDRETIWCLYAFTVPAEGINTQLYTESTE